MKAVQNRRFEIRSSSFRIFFPLLKEKCSSVGVDVLPVGDGGGVRFEEEGPAGEAGGQCIPMANASA
jgi:hypothetical protein